VTIRIPSFLYGTYARARAGVTRAAKLLRRGAAIEELGADWLDVHDAPGLIVLRRSLSSIPAGNPNFHCDLLAQAVEKLAFAADTFEQKIEKHDALVGPAVWQAWSFVAFLDSQQYWLVRSGSHQLRFIDAALQHWDALTQLGPRYSVGSNMGCRLESMPTLLSYAIARQGATAEQLAAPLTASHLREVSATLPGRRVKQLLLDGQLDSAVAEVARHEGTIPMVALADHFLPEHAQVAFDMVERAASVQDPHGIFARWLQDARTGAPFLR
jgi:hypothetical protein